MKLNNDNKTYL